RSPSASRDSLSCERTWSEPQIDREEEAAARRERRHVDVAGYGLVAEVRHLRIEPLVRGEPQQVAATEREPCRPQPEVVRDRGRQLVGDVHLAQLEVGAVLYVDLGVPARPGADPAVAVRDLVDRVSERVVQELRQVDDVPAVLPVPQEPETEALVAEVAG